ncbi:hypothetical protein HOLleu_21697 [Holothuria leucospilota]|uniref:Uncharacterized protein n=1 Tax=Holothuria leucospilota TaxID=206669 RepID=A0A9Q1BY67_HOLLE|nr:hypothetical protein HOLleu_21697 [Holothuria leucospilota]
MSRQAKRQKQRFLEKEERARTDLESTEEGNQPKSSWRSYYIHRQGRRRTDYGIRKPPESTRTDAETRT